MKNLKQPIYDKANLIDFWRKNLWLNSVKESKTSYIPAVQITVLMIAVMIIIIGLHYMVVIEVVNNLDR